MARALWVSGRGETTETFELVIGMAGSAGAFSKVAIATLASILASSCVFRYGAVRNWIRLASSAPRP